MYSSLRRTLLAVVALAAWFHTAAPADAQNPLGISALAAPTLVALAPAGSNLPDLKVGVLSVIPEEALGFAIASNPLETKEEVEGVLRKLNVPFEEENDYIEFNEFLTKLKGWDSKGTHAIVQMPDNDEGEAFLLVPVTNYKEFATSMGADPEAKGPTKFDIDGESGIIAEKANYAVLTESSNLEMLEKFIASKKSIAASCEPVKGYLAKHKTAFVMAPAGVKKLLDLAIDGLKTIRNVIPADNPQAESIKQAFEVYDKLFTVLREETTHVGIGGLLNEKVGADFSMQVVFKPEGKLSAIAKDAAPLPPEAFAGLPDDAYIFAGAGVFPQSSTDLLTQFTMSMMSAMPQGKGLDAEQSKQFAEVLRSTMKGVKQVSMSANFRGETFLSGIAAIYKVDDSAAFLEGYEKSMAVMGNLAKKDKNLPTYAVERKQIDGIDAMVLTTDMAPMFAAMEKQQGDGAKKMIEQMFGEGGKMTAYLAAADKETVVLGYDAKELKELVAAAKAGKNGLGGNVDMQKTAALLMPQPHAIGFMDVGGYIDLVKKIGGMMMAAQGAQGGFPFPIPPFPPSPPVGVAAKLTPQAVELQLVVPMQLMENTRNYVQQFNALIGGGLR